MARKAHECHHCGQWVEAGEAHDCWTTTEAALTADLSDDLRDAWVRLRESAAALGEQRIYASHRCIMFSRRACYCFVRPKRSYLELCVFLGRALRTPEVHRVMPASATKFAHLIRIVHRDQVEAPITDWIAEAYAFVEGPRVAAPRKHTTHRGAKARRAAVGRAGVARTAAGTRRRKP